MFKRRKRREGQAKGRRNSQSGMVLIVAILLVTGLLLIAGTASLNSTGQTKVTSVELDNTRTFYAAEAGVEWGSSALRTLLTSNLDPTQEQLNSLTRPTISGFNYDLYRITKTGTLTQELITSGDYMGLYGYVQRYVVQARASSNRRSSEIQREIQHQYIPLFQFGVFYDNDLEIFPGANMTFLGRIHTNSNLYLGSDGATIQCNSYITAAGMFRHHRKDGAMADLVGNVKIKDQFGVYQDEWRGSYWLDSRRADWVPASLSLWGGMVRDGSHGLTTLRLPLPPATDQHIIVERGNVADNSSDREAKYWYKATRRWVDGALYDSSGHVLTQTGVYTPRTDKFWDARQSKLMDPVDIDVAAMIAGGYAPPNGILYVSSTSTDGGACVRLLNASSLPANGLTIATDLPMYIQGNYNTVNKRGSALLSDAITLLSPSWNDANSHASLGSRIPSNMAVNACIMTGRCNTSSGGSYSGGLENLFRFLEQWGGTVTFRGSIIDLWYSRMATSAWSYGSYYTAPTRDWGFDNDLLSPNKWPPGTPRVHTIQRAAWRQIS